MIETTGTRRRCIAKAGPRVTALPGVPSPFIRWRGFCARPGARSSPGHNHQI